MCFPHCFLGQLFTLFFGSIYSVLSHFVQWLSGLFQHLQPLLIHLLCRLLFLLCAFHVDIPQGPVTKPSLFFPYKLSLSYHTYYPHDLYCHLGTSESQTFYQYFSRIHLSFELNYITTEHYPLMCWRHLIIYVSDVNLHMSSTISNAPSPLLPKLAIFELVLILPSF